MEYTRSKKRQMAKRKVMRCLVIAAVYLAMLTGALTVFLGSVWFVKHTVCGWWILLMGCMAVGGWLFFRFAQEGITRAPVRCH